jgi:predicted phosphodiesterase
MRIAVVSDIHGNLLALEAVMEDLKARSPDEVWCAGDLAWGGPWASECIDIVRDAGWTTVKGNTDIWITGDPQNVEDPTARGEMMEMANAHNISEENAAWLINLPLGHTGPGAILMVHASPQSPFVAPFPDDPPSDFNIYEGLATLVIYGHVHHGFVKRLPDDTIVANPGSVGLPWDGPEASYLLIDQRGPDLTLRHRRIPFDVAAAEAKAKELGGPIGGKFVAELRSRRERA